MSGCSDYVVKVPGAIQVYPFQDAFKDYGLRQADWYLSPMEGRGLRLRVRRGWEVEQ